MGLDDTNDHVGAYLQARPSRREHFVSLAHARRSPDEYLQAPARSLLSLLQQRIG
jgi:hypothetical protein